MSAVSFSDLVSSTDVLSETKFEPWWETLRSYFMKSLFAISLFMFFTTHVSKPISCISTHQTNVTLSNQEYRFINAYCFGKLEWSVRYAGTISTTASVILFMACKSWLLFPSVMNAFRIIREVDDMIGASGLSGIDIESLVFFPRKTKDDKGEIGHACWKIFFRSPGRIYISDLYVIRSVVVAAILVGYVVIASGLIAQEVEMKDTFECQADNTVKSVIGPEKYLCSNELRLQLHPYIISYVVMSLLMLCSIAPFAWKLISSPPKYYKWINPIKNEQVAKNTVKHLQRDYFFIKFLGDNSHCIHTATSKLLEVPSGRYLKLMAEIGLTQAIKNWDRNYINLFLLLHIDSKRHLIKKLKQVEPWKKNSFHEHVFDMAEIFQIAMVEQDFDLVCKLHHGLFFKQDKDLTTRTEIGFEFTGCGCLNRYLSLSDKCGNNTTKRRTGSHVDQQPLVSGNNAGTSTSTDELSLLYYICNICYDGTFDPVMTEHFLKIAGIHDVKMAESVNGSHITAWLTNKQKEVNEKQRDGWNEMLRVLLQYRIIGRDDKKRLSVAVYSDPNGDKSTQN